jgi:integrase
MSGSLPGRPPGRERLRRCRAWSSWATPLDEGGLSARQIADQLGHAKVSMTQDNYIGRRLTNRRTAQALDNALGRSL